MKTFILLMLPATLVGLLTIMLTVASSLGIGHFRYIYGPGPYVCTSDFPLNPLNPQ